KDAGAIYVYDRRTLDDPHPQRITASKPHAGDIFGYSLALSGPWLAVGAPSDSNGSRTEGADTSLHKSAAVHVYRRDDSTGLFELAQYIKAEPVMGAEDWFGSGVAIDGDLMVIGASTEDGGGTGVTGDPNDDSVTDSGAVYVYRLVSGQWTLQQYVKPTNTAV